MHGIQLKQTYRTDKACKNYILLISKEFKTELREQEQRERFISARTDSATDVGVREVYVCFVKDGEAVNAYVGLKSCSNAAL